jgi:ribosomal protein S18 acetylase RimI-like enzyme
MSFSVHNAERSDLHGVIAAHFAAFPGYFMTLLGPRFLYIFYRYFLDNPLGILLLARDESGRVLGFLAGTRQPAGFFRALRNRHAVSLLLAVLPAAFRHPVRVTERLLSAVRYRGDAPPGLPGYWLLSSLGVNQEFAGSGVGTALVTRFVADAEQTQAAGIYLVTDSDDNEAAKAFYDRRGFVTHTTRVRRDGRRMDVMVRGLK